MTSKFYTQGQQHRLVPGGKEITPGRICVTNQRVILQSTQCYDVSDINNPSEVAIFERGYKESEQIMYFLSQKKQELVVMRNGRPNSTDTTYNIYPTTR